MDVGVVRSSDHAYFPAISHQYEADEDEVQASEAARSRPGRPVDLPSRPSSADSFNSKIFSAPGDLVSSMEASLLLGDASPSIIPHTTLAQQQQAHTVYANTMADGTYTKNQDQSPPSSPQLKPNDDGLDVWRDFNVSGGADRPMTKAEFLDRQTEKVLGTYKKLSHLRERNLETRLRAQEMRNQLQEEREVAASADEKFIKALNALFATNHSEEIEGIRRLYEDCRKLRDDYRPLENSYNALEDQVHQEEYELDHVERKLYIRTNKASDLGESTFLTEYPSSHSSFVSEDVFIEYPSKAAEYISSRADAKMVRERLHDHRTRRAMLMDAEQYRKLHGLELDVESKSFLAHFDLVHESLQTELAAIESALEDLAKICVEQGLWGMIDYSELDELLQLDENTVPRPDLLLEDDDVCLKMEVMHEDDQLQVQNLEDLQQTEPINRTRYINSWLYRSLRSSRFQIFNLKYTIWWETMKDPQEVSQLILEWWPRDKAALSPVIAKGSTRGYSTTSARNEIPRRALSLRDEKEPISWFSTSRSQA